MVRVGVRVSVRVRVSIRLRVRVRVRGQGQGQGQGQGRVGVGVRVTRDGPRHGRSVEVVVGQPLRHVALGDAGARLELSQVQDELVRAQAGLARVEHLVVVRVRVRVRVQVRG